MCHPNSSIGIPMRCYHGNTLPGFVVTTIIIIIIINNHHLLYIAISLVVFPTTCNLTQIPSLVNFMTSKRRRKPQLSSTNGALGLEVWKSPSLFWYKAYDRAGDFPGESSHFNWHKSRAVFKRLHPGRLTWNLQITHLERKIILQPPWICSMLIFQGVNHRGGNNPNMIANHQQYGDLSNTPAIGCKIPNMIAFRYLSI